MDIRRLELLRELADRGSVGAVARAAGRTPSAVSQQLKVLEREAGVPLTERSGRGIVLTDAGRALARTATDIAVAVARGRGALGGLPAPAVGRGHARHLPHRGADAAARAARPRRRDPRPHAAGQRPGSGRPARVRRPHRGLRRRHRALARGRRARGGVSAS
ncbi:LysR family transcriptional regulator [Clavibacter zhangzhiyongii]|uniref:LysR family transcriptional regulator n=1 Tax=Clavibacter zhangzhiyongii TaxID=2768071 RepID=UPI0039E1F492